MQPYQHILIAIDYSEFDPAVIQKACNMAKQTQATLSLLHVFDNIAMPDTAYGTRISLDKPSDYALLNSEKNRLRQIADTLNIDHDHAWLIWGSPQQEIVHLAEQQAIDLIVMGFHTKQGLALLLGSTANSVLHHAKCDLLAVHLPAA
ncbi:MAG: universal stress protein [Methylococcaceae bacterium]